MTQHNNPRVSTAGIKVLKVMKALAGHALTGISNGELSKRLEMDKATVNRSLETLMAESMATKLPNGCYAPSIEMLQIAQRHANAVAEATDRINEIQQRIAAGSMNEVE